MNSKSRYKLDLDKVNSIDDIKRILKVLDISFAPNYAPLESIKDLIKIEEKPLGVPITISGQC